MWVQSPVHHAPPVEGYVLGWQRREGRWRAQVLFALDDPRSTAGPIILQRWMRVEDLRPRRTESPQSPDAMRWHLGWRDDPQGAQWKRIRNAAGGYDGDA